MLSTLPVGPDTDLLARAQGGARLRLGVVAANGQVALASARAAWEAGLADPVLFGEPGAMARAAEAIGWDISALERVDAPDAGAAALAASRMAGAGGLAALMKGDLHTDVLLRGVLDRDAGLRIGRRLTHVFHMSFPDDARRIVITDAAVNVAPDEETLFQAAANAVQACRAAGKVEPRVAFLSATEDPIPSMPSSEVAARVAERCRAEIPGALFAGPLAMDNAISASAAEAKGIAGPVAGHADVLVVPNIETGNAIFKTLVYCRAACAAGVVIGAKVPVILTSRADPPAARLTACALAVCLSRGTA